MPDQLNKQPLAFFLLVLLLSLPFWWLGSLPADTLRAAIPINLPLSALMAVCPVTAGAVLTYRAGGFQAVRALVGRTFDFRKIQRKTWYAPVLLLLPLIYLLAYLAMRLLGRPLPEPRLHLLDALVFFLLFFVSGALEELGWVGYATDPLQARWGALKTGLFLGVFWALWHAVPYAQAGNSAGWIFWQCVFSVAQRVLIAWIYNNTGRSVFAAILFHAMSNVCWTLFPNYGSHYDPLFTGILTSIAAGVVIIICEPWTLREKRSEE